MNIDKSKNSSEILGRKIKQGLTKATNDAKTQYDLSIPNVRAGFQQRFGAFQMESMIPNSYALFGSWSGSSRTVGP